MYLAPPCATPTACGASSGTLILAAGTDNPLYLLGEARIHDALNDVDASLALYKRVLHLEACNVEAIACMAAQHFYSDQPEVALRFYRRLLMLGVANAEMWNNMGLCCFYASQMDITLRCFENALLVADDLVQADVWCGSGAGVHSVDVLRGCVWGCNGRSCAGTT